MYLKSPMENFNKNNPFIIVAKKVYDRLIDEIHLFSREYIRILIINGTISLIAIGLMVYTFINSLYSSLYLIVAVIMLVGTIMIMMMNLLIYSKFRKIVKYYMGYHPALIEFSRISKMEVSDILSLNNEDLFNCVNRLYEAYGEFSATKKYYPTSVGTVYLWVLNTLSIIFSIIWIVVF